MEGYLIETKINNRIRIDKPQRKDVLFILAIAEFFRFQFFCVCVVLSLHFSRPPGWGRTNLNLSDP